MADSVVDRVTELILQRIRTGAFEQGEPLPSERRLCQDFAVSRSTLRLAVNRLGRSGSLLLRANRQPIVAASAPRFIGLWLWPAFEDYGSAAIAKGVQRALASSPDRLYIPSARGADWQALVEGEVSFLREIARDPNAEGLLIWSVGGAASVEALKLVRASGKPIVFIDRAAPDGFDADFVGTDNLGASRNLVEQVVRLGHRRIAYVSNGENASSVSDRVEGYRQALSEDGILFDPTLLVTLRSSSSQRNEVAADRLIAEILAIPGPPTAIVCVNDSTALLITEALQKNGVNVPDEISVVGFDGLLRWIPGGGRLATAEQSFERIGEMAGRLLLERILTGRSEPYRHILLDAPLRNLGSLKDVRPEPTLQTALIE